MDKWLVNMVAGAVLSALLVIFGTSTFVNIIYPTGGGPEEASAHGGDVATTEHGTADAASDSAPKVTLASLLTQASADAGSSQAKKCAACHTFEEGGPNKIGPNLHGVVGRPVGSHEGFAYSNAMKELGGNWDYEKLNCYLENPKGCVPGNKMSFGGIKKDSDRADVIAYLRSVSPDAPPLPAAAAEETKGSDSAAATDNAKAAAPSATAPAAAPSDQPAAAADNAKAAAPSATAPAAAPSDQPAAAADNAKAAAPSATAPAEAPSDQAAPAENAQPEQPNAATEASAAPNANEGSAPKPEQTQN